MSTNNILHYKSHMDVCLQGLTGAIHETGHALYEQGRNLEYDGLPVNEVCCLLHLPLVATNRPFCDKSSYLLLLWLAMSPKK